MKHSILSIKHILIAFLVLISCISCEAIGSSYSDQGDQEMAELPQDIEGLSIATFAGGCFWCTEAVFERVKGVKYVISGYSGGSELNPTYKQVSYGNTTHAEAIQIYYDPSVIGFDKLLEVFFLGAHDPTQVNRQGPDRGPQYRSVAFYRNDEERIAIVAEINKLEDSGKFPIPIATQVTPFEKFYPAEKYHQDYYSDSKNLGNPYVQNVTRPKVEKFQSKFGDLLKPEYK